MENEERNGRTGTFTYGRTVRWISRKRTDKGDRDFSEKGRDRDIDRTKPGRKINYFKDYRKAAAGDLRQRLCGKHQAV